MLCLTSENTHPGDLSTHTDGSGLPSYLRQVALALARGPRPQHWWAQYMTLREVTTTKVLVLRAW